ncbi:prolyl oligopeptidase family serine peptidase [Coralloluteibacterium thermophilus]|uniref:Prolyl oligopeptidase family protein n=1 Tax=Coralloluteibacterium thermophilum TaxID=2707049 RepID=A0ABV9NRR4_9GAMM
MSRWILRAGLALAVCACTAVEAGPGRPPGLPVDLDPAAVAAADDHLHLETLHGAEAMAFVDAANARARARLEGDARFEPFRQRALSILTADDRLSLPRFQSRFLDELRQGRDNPRGLWRRVRADAFRGADSDWQVLLDVDALARAGDIDWVLREIQCLPPAARRCLVGLSVGGKDAVVVREFDAVERRFLDEGFRLPEAKQRVQWLDEATLLVAADFGVGTLTESGYPYTIRALRRGERMQDAPIVYSGAASDGGYGVAPRVVHAADGAVEAVLFLRPLDTYRSEVWQQIEDRSVRLDLPSRLEVHGIFDGRLVFTANEDWACGRHPIPAGALAAVPLEVLRGEAAPSPTTDPVVVLPAHHEAISGVAVARNALVVAVLDNVSGALRAMKPSDDGGWQRQDVDVPAHAAVRIIAASRGSVDLFYSAEGFLSPPTLFRLDTDTAIPTPVQQQARHFEPGTHVVEQHEAVSRDGTRVPYFLVRPRSTAADDEIPTILYAYGGGGIPILPTHSAQLGALWLEHGGAFVLASIRGGGEFGPRWHAAALRDKRQHAFDDFAAVAENLIARGITSPRRLGIYGRSNGGVLTSVAITQRPGLFNAAVIESPVIDMLRYPEMPPGASWTGEYGDPRIPEEARWLAAYSAYHHLRPEADYPVVYITTNTLDDRVHPGHARKFAARLGAQGHDHIYFEDESGGHAYDADPPANARRWARHYVYFAQRLMD